MQLLVCYDVSTRDRAGQQRLRRVARLCQGFGHRVQKSLFECEISEVQYVELRQQLLDVIDPGVDDLRIYTLSATSQLEHVGKNADLREEVAWVL